jgi:hypothetical protein
VIVIVIPPAVIVPVLGVAPGFAAATSIIWAMPEPLVADAIVSHGTLVVTCHEQAGEFTTSVA